MRKVFAANLRQARIAKGYRSARKAAFDLGIKPGTYTHHENGTRPIDLDMAKLYASFFNVDIRKIFDVRGLPLPHDADVEISVASEAAAMGVWRSVALDTSEQKGNKRSLRLPPSRKVSVRKAVEMADESCNRSIPSGWHGIYTPLDRPLGELHNRLVYIERERNGLIERSIRRVIVLPDGALDLCADSDDHRYRNDVVHYPSDGETIRIVGRIVGKYLESDNL